LSIESLKKETVAEAGILLENLGTIRLHTMDDVSKIGAVVAYYPDNSLDRPIKKETL
jgi:hypothetical protein